MTNQDHSDELLRYVKVLEEIVMPNVSPVKCGVYALVVKDLRGMAARWKD